MHHFSLVTIFPEIGTLLTNFGITRRAFDRGLYRLDSFDPRDFSDDAHHTVDDAPYGGGPGMVMKVAPLRAAIAAARRSGSGDAWVVCLTPQGPRLDQAGVAALAARRRLILVAGRYEGIDERVIERDVDQEISIGDYVLSGGELPALVVLDAVIRLLPGALGDADSAAADSFSGGLLDFPQYTRPEMVDGQPVPPVLLSGNHQAIARWRRKQALGRTWERRPDLLAEQALSAADAALLAEYRAERR